MLSNMFEIILSIFIIILHMDFSTTSELEIRRIVMRNVKKNDIGLLFGLKILTTISLLNQHW